MRQRGISLIEILLTAVVASAAIVGVFVFAAKAKLAASVEREQEQVHTVVSAVEHAFALQPNFAGLGTDGAEVLRNRAPRAEVAYARDDSGKTVLATAFGGQATVVLAVEQVDFPNGMPGKPNNGFSLTYTGLSAPECVGLVGATAALTTRIDLVPSTGDSTLVAGNGEAPEDPALVASLCANNAAVRLSFAPARAIVAGPPPAASVPAVCSPVRERTVVACPAGQEGSITQERFGTCTGPSNSMIYTAWVEVDRVCHEPATAPPEAVPDTPAQHCGKITRTKVLACPWGQTGLIVAHRTIDSCTGVGEPWITVQDSCADPVQATCRPDAEVQSRAIACPTGGGQQIQERVRNSSCPVLDEPEVWGAWSAWSTISSNCQANCLLAGNCCQVRKDGPHEGTQPCPAGTYGVVNVVQERFLGCLDATTQAPNWSDWHVLGREGSCTACPPTSNEVEERWIRSDGPCPDGLVGSITYEDQQVRTRPVSFACPAGTTSLPGPTYGSWTGWTDGGVRRVVANTCAPPAECALPAGTTLTWVVGGNSCSSTLATARTIATGSNLSVSDTVGPATGAAAFACTASGMDSTPLPGASCTVAPTACPSPSGVFREYSDEGDWHAPDTPGQPWFNPQLSNPSVLAAQFARGTRCTAADVGRFLSVGQGGYAGEWYSWLFVCRPSGFVLVAEGEPGRPISWASGFTNTEPYSTAVANSHQGLGWNEPQGWKTAYGPFWQADWVCGAQEPAAPASVSLKATGFFGSPASWWMDSLTTSLDIYAPGNYATGPTRYFLGACPGGGYPPASSYNMYDVCVPEAWPPAGSASCSIPAGTTFNWANSDASGVVKFCSASTSSPATVASGAELSVAGAPATNRASFLCVNGRMVVWPTWNNCS